MRACRLASVVAGLIFSANIAFAAGKPALPDLPDLDDVTEATVPDAFGGWYLRGGIGVGAATSGSFRKADVEAQPQGFVDTRDFGRPVTADFGVGYDFGGWGRYDATIEHRFDGSARISQGYFASAAGANVSGEWKGDLSSTLLMANAYYDLGTWAGVTPFLGAGLGAAYTGPLRLPLFGASGGSGSAAGRGQWGFAWALMAGLAYQVTPSLTAGGELSLSGPRQCAHGFCRLCLRRRSAEAQGHRRQRRQARPALAAGRGTRLELGGAVFWTTFSRCDVFLPACDFSFDAGSCFAYVRQRDNPPQRGSPICKDGLKR